jgi:hypothetical protein
MILARLHTLQLTESAEVDFKLNFKCFYSRYPGFAGINRNNRGLGFHSLRFALDFRTFSGACFDGLGRHKRDLSSQRPHGG